MQGLRGGVVLVSHDREFLARCVTPWWSSTWPRTRWRCTTAATRPSWRSGRWPAGTPARPTTSSPDKKADLVGARAHPARVESQGVRNAMKKSPDNDKIRRRASTESSREAGAEGPADGVAGSPGSTRSRSRARSGSCSSASAPHRGRARVVATLERGRRPPAATSRSARSRCRSTPASASASPVPTARASPPCCGCCWDSSEPDDGRAALGASVADRRDRPGARPARGGPAARRRLRGAACLS